MADIKSVIVPLNGKNYPTWKIQCRMALVKDSLWSIVSGTETEPTTEGEARRKYLAKRDRALATIVLAIDPTLLYLIGADPKDPQAVWTKLEEQFQRKTWANKLQLRRKLFALKLKEGESVNEHIKTMSEIFAALSVIGDPVGEEDKVVHLLASLPDSYDMLVTALEAQSENVPKWELVTERIIHEELKLREKATSIRTVDDGRKALAASSQKFGKGTKSFKCHFCHKPGHYKKDCRKYLASKKTQVANQAEKKRTTTDGEVLVTTHALTTTYRGNWIVDSGATCHMSNDKAQFIELRQLKTPQEVKLGDGRSLEAVAEGTVGLETLLPDGSTKQCTLNNVLLVPGLSYSLLSVSKASLAGKKTKFDKNGCEVLNEQNKVIAFATRVGNLYHLEHCRTFQAANMTDKESKENLWHRRYGHLGEQNLQRIAREKLVKQFNYDVSNTIGFCETCIGGKHHRSPFASSTTKTTKPLEIVHSDVCGKMQEKSLGGAEYFLTFTDDKTRYTWVYILKTKDQVFDCFLHWKALVERQSKQKLKTLRTDNGGEYTSNKFEKYLKDEGIRHEKTIPKTPEQNGVAERLNRTLVESARSMLLDANLSKSYWAEAVSTAVYLKNRSPTKAVQGETPYEAWYGEKPTVDHLRVFGCDAYAHIPKDERRKFDTKARKCILVGYGEETKGYRLYDVTEKKILYSRDVQFNEKSRKFNSGQDVQEQDYKLIIDLSNDIEIETEGPDSEIQEVPLRRSTRQRSHPDYYGREQSHLTETPSTFKDANASPEKKKWKIAMEKEMNSLQDNDVWDLVELPPGRKIIGSKWVFKKKTGVDGTVERYKARLVAQGYTQKYGADYDETFCPVVRQESLRVLIALSVKHGLKLHQVDVTTAFLNGTLEEEVFMKQPEGFEIEGKKHLVCRLKKSIYGLKQSPRCWNVALDTQLKRMGFTQSENDPCIYYRNTGGEMFYIGVYVDDIILAGKTDNKLTEVKTGLSRKFDIKDLGELSYFLGMKVEQRESAVWIGQPAYTKNLVESLGMQDCKPVVTPVSIGSTLNKATDDDECVDQKKYQSAIGSLMYLSVCTRPDIAYSVDSLARFTSKPTKEHWTALKRLLRYLKGTLQHGILYTKDGSSSCVGYTDADWAGDVDDRKSTSGYVFLLSGGAISWKSQKQRCVALSTAEAEYVAMASAAQESVWLRQLIAELTNTSTDSPTLIFEDNQSAIAMTKNPQFHGRAKHIDIKHHFIRQLVAQGTIVLEYCPTVEMAADMLTKGLGRETFCKLRDMIGMVEP